jgi:hypothetical protein
MGTTISSIEETCVQASTAEKTEIFTKLLKLIELAPQCQSQYETDPIAAATHAPIASPPALTQALSSAPASPASEPTHEIAPPPSAPEPPSLSQTASQSDSVPEPISAVARCTAARTKARSDALARSQSRYTADDAGAKAFRSAMPPLLGAENIREFIACVAHGMLIEVIGDRAATKLLYAAQVAFSAQNRTEPKRTPKSAAIASENN